ncbi:MAG: hypothetical protein EZS26_002146 [Candidatus Ordinivivax streblomastigis]|uniref:Uncharacterized protein n=1 Tax=Candidatus Ordinivivax streblomastigis TaxID=2540710 RepID=A0A5M8NZV7_9BACT|nr:MAG: hypothetical protein EZS26_002146 [Candidatus Ordinivivax streblomastigis]
MKKTLLIFFIIHYSFFIALAQDEKPKIFEFTGYVKEMPAFYVLQNEIPISVTENMKRTWYNLVHNRLNLSINPFKDFKINVGMRNRFLCGDMLKKIPPYADVLAVDNGLVDLSWNVLNKNGFVLNSSFDRAYLDYTFRNVQVKIGRQRINWGIGLVWNPNDIFNAFSYIDFDYEERPGSDAVSVTWYKSATSSFDFVGKINKNPLDSSLQSTIAARYLFNVKSYDFQFLGGKFNNDFVGGFGWSGAIKNVSFRGEMSLFTPIVERNINKTTAFAATVEADYTFSNSFYLHGAMLFNSLGKLNSSEGMNLFATQNDLSAKKLSYGKFEIFSQATYPVSLIFSVGLAAMLNPADLSAYVSPTLTVSLHDNLELALVSQLLLGKTATEYAALGNVYAGFARLKWNF